MINGNVVHAYLHPAHPQTPRIWRIPYAMNEVAIVVRDRVVQNILSLLAYIKHHKDIGNGNSHLRRLGSSRLV